MALLGVKELKADFRKIGNAMGATLRVAAYAGARIVRDKAKAIAPRKTGRSVRFIAAARKRGSKTLGLAEVGFLKPAFNYVILERGSKAHTITARAVTILRNPRTRAKIGTRLKKRKVLVTKEGRFLGTSVRHPGFSARPFLESALNQSKEQVLQAMTEKFNAAIEGKLS